jgi:two-component system chemotaxis response regulator CheY
MPKQAKVVHCKVWNSGYPGSINGDESPLNHWDRKMITVDILVIDSSPLIRYAISAYLSRVQYEVTAVSDAQVIWERLRRNPPALLITAWPMPGGHGIELVRHIRSLNGPHYTYILLLTRRNQQNALIAGLEAGADDYMVKPLDLREVRRRVLLGRRIQKLESGCWQLQHEREDLVVRDPLTQVLNRQTIYERVAQELAAYHRAGRSFSLMLLELEGLVQLNERYGYDCGDQALRLLADTLTRIIRQQDLVGRWSGSRFLLILNETILPTAQLVANRIHSHVEDQELMTPDGQHVALRIRVGVVNILAERTLGLSRLIQQAENILEKDSYHY